MQIKVRVRAGASRESIKKTGNRYDITVREEAARNQANARVVAVIARELGVPQTCVKIRKGHASPTKTVEISRGV